MRKSLDEFTKDDWIKANTHGNIDDETVIYRIFRADYLLLDLFKGVNTLVNPCYETQGDDLENPLKSALFDVDGRDHQLFSSMMGEYYSQSWSLTKGPWGVFGEGEDVVRVKSTIGNLFRRLMDDADPYYSLYYHVGLIDYDDATVIKEQIDNSHFSDFLDSQGFGLLKTVMKIRSDFSKEEEVRLVYIRSPRPGVNEVPLKNAVFGDQAQFCSHIFEWSGVLDSYEMGPNNRSHHAELVAALKGLGVAAEQEESE